MKPQKKLKTYNITYRPDPDNRYNNVTVTYKANSMNEAKEKFYKEFPSQKDADYLEIHSPLENYAIDRENEKLAETSNNDNDTTTDSTNTIHPPKMKSKFKFLPAALVCVAFPAICRIFCNSLLPVPITAVP